MLLKKVDAINVMQVVEAHIHLTTHDIAFDKFSNSLIFFIFYTIILSLPQDGPVVLEVCSERFPLLFSISWWIVV